MIIWPEEAYGIDKSYKAMCQILATDGDGVASLKEMAGTVSFQSDAGLTTPLWREMEVMLDGGGRERLLLGEYDYGDEENENWLSCPRFQMLDYVISLSRFLISTRVARKS